MPTPPIARARSFRTVEPFLWNDQRFRALADDVKLVWLQLLTSPAHDRFRCEGLIECTLHDVARLLGWVNGVVNAAVVDGLARAEAAVHALAALGWVEVDSGVGLMLLPKAVAHNPPPNLNVVRHWLAVLGRVPPSLLRVHWVYHAAAALRRHVGREDARTRALEAVRVILHGRVKALQAAARAQQTAVKGVYRGYAAHGDDFVGVALAGPPDEPAQQEIAAVPPKAAAPPKNKAKKALPPKPIDPPADFTPRERAIWAAFRNPVNKFDVSGRGSMTFWEYDHDPVQFCRQLAGDGYPAVHGPSLIARLANHTTINKRNVKSNLRQYIMRNFRGEQDKFDGKFIGKSGRNVPMDAPRASSDRPLDEMV